MSPALRVGIDVGGTFTDVVVVEAGTRTIVARVKVPTTHGAATGVAEGIIAALRRALAAPGVDVARIAFIAHSTTQATNALLEGDVASVGIVGLYGRLGWLEREQLRLPPIRLGPTAMLSPSVAFARAGDERALERAVDTLLVHGAQAIVASEAFGVDTPARERRAVAYARERGSAATAGHEVATTYGLRARTRTAVVNAAILPRMERTSRLTADAVTNAGIGVPLMIMRSDGGVMDVAEVARRPILTMLSGPAAGIAGALLHESVTDGIFIEVGGTSADCSVIRRGQPQMRPAQVGGHRTMLRTLDVRTLAIAGGSIMRFDPKGRGLAALRDVGPRSAHIAGLGYACFADPAQLGTARVIGVRPQPGDPDDYLALELGGGFRITLTPTCAANFLGYVPPHNFARGDDEAARSAFTCAGAHFGVSAEALAHAILVRATDKLHAAIQELIADYELAREDVELIGGGGGAAALVPFTADRFGYRYRLARDAEVISPLGVALALVRDVVERTILAPTPADIVRVRREAHERVVAAGAAPDLVEVTVEIDARRNLVRAIASGATAAESKALVTTDEANDSEKKAAAARALRANGAALAEEACAGTFVCYRAAGAHGDTCVVDSRGVVRLIARRARVATTTVGHSQRVLAALIDEMTAFGDVGRALPEVHLAYGTRLADLGTLSEVAHVLALAAEELRGLGDGVAVALIAARRNA
ncbi:MAG: hydantoinase/oxoprolinase [Candidatus Eremiobacteraeota bacterium]|nr:hydantoinase/oxoprolinase [Candidatus Eremiobacteraeota bacterium]MBC5804065.1 hydantoinase/oxoprolinase [Candidatus Eremiobacteraeota bacterium]MBC5821640.1 hydantoinase/oxoprolinase [Candidatus Eremiobacteraeota bacterium]